MDLTEIPWFAVIVATAVNIAIAMTWFAPAFLGTWWAKGYGISPANMKASPFHYAAAIVNSAVMAMVLAGLVHYFHLTNWSQAMCFGFWIWLGLIATSHLSGVIWAKKSIMVYLIEVGFYLVSIEVLLTIFTFWPFQI